MTFLEAEKLISFSEITSAMVDFIADYFDPISKKDFWASRNVDFTKLTPKEETKKHWLERIEKDKVEKIQLPNLAILFDNQPIGFHVITHIEEKKQARFHSHFWNHEFRGKEIALYTYPRACKIFIERFGFEKIYFITPTMNIGPNRVKEKLKIPRGEIRLINDSMLMLKNTPGFYYELNLEQIDEICNEQKKLNRLSIEN